MPAKRKAAGGAHALKSGHKFVGMGSIFLESIIQELWVPILAKSGVPSKRSLLGGKQGWDTTTGRSGGV